jgi:hypothetical protein
MKKLSRIKINCGGTGRFMREKGSMYVGSLDATWPLREAMAYGLTQTHTDSEVGETAMLRHMM